ncbi:hypothetical protein [Leptospira sarikeiensis]|uniref:DUF5683 domain-containing protein n=1 Tax=Leptospira sarikeiensis TaxID=2484943 RepID=A0A4R9KDZ0_9LEPT|nr:hypothetical protein [Leptospira sarikeiensis]TGL63402.1 hypothetical protein EHQ64_05450 [Leptospira sarikeiensis]
MKKIIVLSIILSSFISIHSQEFEKKEENISAGFQDRSRWDLVWRSAVLPGWGLLHAKAYRKGIFTLGITSILLIYEYKGHKEEEEKKQNLEYSRDLFLTYSYFNSQIDPQSYLIFAGYQHKKQEDLEELQSKNDLKLGLLGLKYFLQLAYTYWYGIKWEGENTSGFRLDIRTASFANKNGGETGLDLKYTFMF